MRVIPTALAWALSVILLVAAGDAHAQSSLESAASPPPPMLIRSDASVRLLDAGRSALVSFKFREAEQHFTRLANLPDGRAAGMYHLSLVSFLRYTLSDRDDDMLDFVQRSDELKRVLDDEPDAPWRNLLGAETNMQRAVVWAKQGRYVRAALAGRGAYKTYSRLVSDHPEFDEAYKGYGLLKVALATLPATYRRFLSLVGYSGDATVGYGALRRAAREGGYMADEASLYLALFDVTLNGSRSDGRARLRELTQRYPDSPLFAHLYGYYLMENRHAHEAEASFRKVVATRDDPSVFYLDYTDHFLALTLFRQNRFEESIGLFERYRTEHPGLALRGPTLLYMGLALEMTGRRDEAVTLYREVESSREFDADAASYRRARALIEQPMSDVERSLLRGANAYDAGRYKEALSILAAVFDSAPGTDERAEAAYRLARVYHATGELETAVRYYGRCTALRGSSMTRWAPWSAYYKGEALRELGREEEAREAFRSALAYDGPFDYHQALENNARLALAAQ